MIRYPITPAELTTAINNQNGSWLKRATERTKRFKGVGCYSEAANIWSEIKAVYLLLQHNKCGYCERQLEGSIEHDIEHFRPKRSVPVWPPRPGSKNQWGNLAYSFPTGRPHSTGYYLLSYHPWNYVASCKFCNTILKSDYFPVASFRATRAVDPWRLKQEKAFLIYPLGDVDNDPQVLIDFIGILARPHPLLRRSRHLRRRAQVTIDFFQLNSREHLLRERSQHLVGLHIALENARSEPDVLRKQRFTEYVQFLTSPKSPHTSCMQSFHELFRQDSVQAERLADEAQSYLNSLINA